MNGRVATSWQFPGPLSRTSPLPVALRVSPARVNVATDAGGRAMDHLWRQTRERLVRLLS